MTTPPPRSETELAEYLRGLDTPAPAGLRARVAALEPAPSHRRMPGRLAPALAAAVALIALVVVLASRGGARPAPTVHDVASLGGLPVTEPAPARSASDPATLSRAVGGVSFPDWANRGLRAVGARSDTIAGRQATTVFYRAAGGPVVAYTILAGSGPHSVSGGATDWSNGIEYRLFTAGGRNEIAWIERGRLCVISVRGALPTALRHELTG